MKQALHKTLAELGVTHFGEIAVEAIVFNPAFRAACAANQCGKYGTNWACPPGVGTPEELAGRVRRFTRGLVIQTVWPLADAFDFEGMMEAAARHNSLFRRVAAHVAARQAPMLALSAGACDRCETCTYAHGEPCRLPGQAIASLEAYCMDVAALLDAAGLRYNNGPGTVSYVGLILCASPLHLPRY